MHLQAVVTEHLRVPPRSVRLRRVNVGTKERIFSTLLGGALSYLAKRQSAWWRRASLGAAAAVLVKRGVSGRCGLFGLLHVSTVADMPHRGVYSGGVFDRARARMSHAQRSVTILKPRHELFAFWRDFNNLPRFMQNLEAVQALDAQHARWVWRGLGGRLLEYETEIQGEAEGEHITWLGTRDGQSLFRADVKFRDAAANRGTEVTLTVGPGEPGGHMDGNALVLMSKDPERQVRDDLARFKQLMEAGEIVTAAGPSARGGAR
jgi:uncharacterized membrane protein